jgi:hypothetical protein
VFALAGGLLLLPLPCADDLLVETGAAPDQCVAAGLSSQSGQGSPSPGASICPCACHAGIAAGPALAQLPERQQVTLLTPMSAIVLDPVSSAITHPPLG